MKQRRKFFLHFFLWSLVVFALLQFAMSGILLSLVFVLFLRGFLRWREKQSAALSLALAGIFLALGILWSLYQAYCERNYQPEANFEFKKSWAYDSEFQDKPYCKTDGLKICLYPNHNRYVSGGEKKDKSNAILLLGCSFTWGQGVSDEDTFASYLQKYTQSRVVNYGYNGGDASFALLHLRGEGEMPLPPFAYNTVIYTFISGHIRRDNGTGIYRYSGYLPNLQWEQGGFRRHGNFFQKNHGPFLVRKLGASVLLDVSLRFLNFDSGFYLREIAEQEVEKSALLVNAMAAYAQERYGAKFILNLWPEREFPKKKKFLSLLDPRVLVWEYAGVPLTQLADGHPSPEANQKIGLFLAKKLKELP